MSSYLQRKQRFPDAKNANLASSFLSKNEMWSRDQQQLMFNVAMEILSRKNANRRYRNQAHDILYLLAKNYPKGGYGRFWHNHPTHMHYKGFPNENWNSPPRRRPTPPKRRPSPPRPPRTEYTLNTFARARKDRNTFNRYALAWFKVDFHGKPLNRKMALAFWPNRHPGNNRGTVLSQLFTELYK
jgi:hypothetical protein